MADDELDTLYWAPPDEFTAERKKLAKAAKDRGDAATAKEISAARRPTTAAWMVNRLVIGQRDAKSRLAELGDSLRAAHAAMDGVQIRELSARQHTLINELTRAAFDAADLKKPSAAVRDDVAGTLQAAIADPDVAARLGRLAKAEQWSGFGDFGDVTAVSKPARGDRPATPPKAKPKPKPKAAGAPERDKDAEAARRQREKLTAALAAAERAEAKADRALSERRAAVEAAEQRRDEALKTLRAAERELSAAEDRYRSARDASEAAADAAAEARARLQRG
ncbi:hypothetical protein A5645_23895 [Mycobacterium asiaticum]|uniref:hypothetical protein n=1 Tax=Mycobacterium asiaticum TaxID=1790 RepID=UPI0007EF67F8|nr:hypothetical protein [Mycobacterium asiaticum]OBK92333.1 hypothetical protein A5645_23895 [Mycobacterium asiaticum]